MRYAAAVAGAEANDGGDLPLEKWNPDYCGAIDLVIRADGVWIHEGSPIGRARLVRLLSRVIRKDPDGYVLVTPAEKLSFHVEDAPFIAVAMEARPRDDGGPAGLVFTTNVGDVVAADAAHPVVMRRPPAALAARGAADVAPRPYIHIRRGLWARVARPVYYDLAARGEYRQMDGEERFGVASGGAFFPLADAGVINSEDHR